MTKTLFYAQADFGALGNDSADDTAALATALAAVPAGCVLTLEPGTYRTSAPLTRTTPLHLWGRGARLRPLFTSGSALTLQGPPDAAGLPSVLGKGSIDGLAFLTARNWANPLTALTLVNIQCWQVDGVDAYGFTTSLEMVAVGHGCAYNRVGTRNLSACKTCLHLRTDATAGGYLAENTFSGGGDWNPNLNDAMYAAYPPVLVLADSPKGEMGSHRFYGVCFQAPDNRTTGVQVNGMVNAWSFLMCRFETVDHSKMALNLGAPSYHNTLLAPTCWDYTWNAPGQYNTVIAG